LTREEFEALAQEALDSLPEELQRKMDNVYIVVEDMPSADAEKKVRLGRGSMLLGLYEGVPMSKRGVWYGSSAIGPDRITLFRKNIESSVRHPSEIAAKIRDVLIHEIAHHFLESCLLFPMKYVTRRGTSMQG
jgi:predicted Zn-dependent protease with MMP-like domain